jgi:acyl-CoA synthetase (AMP-forming)/AMP-acid ligase II
LGLWSIGAAPAMINYNLAAKALVHCLKVPKVKLLLVDEDPELRKRIEDEQATLEGELDIKIVVMDSLVKADIRTQKTERPEDLYREGVKGTSPAALIYTRFVIRIQHAQQEQDADNVKVELQVYLKHVLSKSEEHICQAFR